MTRELVFVGIAYLLGSLPTALLAVRWVTGGDVRKEGSGNVGATNATRSAGLKVGIIVTIVDVGKGVLAVLLMTGVNPSASWQTAAVLAAMLGHCYPVWLRFHGGKGVATAFGAVAVMAPIPCACGLATWIVLVFIARYVSVASMGAAASLPMWLVLVDDPPLALLAGVSGAAVLVLLRHISNMKRLARGEEDRLGRGPGGV
ncbi:MAG: glycerol-3-phosphate 1-O-acyltransferase PlsY [bacterium]|nr:glycerol-3-phosphate 1-O-acyltransferase PlsY [bacterium]